MFNDILMVMPKCGKARWDVSRGDIETVIDRAFERLAKESSYINSGFIQGIYCAYVSMCMAECDWEDIHFMVEAANKYELI